MNARKRDGRRHPHRRRLLEMHNHTCMRRYKTQTSACIYGETPRETVEVKGAVQKSELLLQETLGVVALEGGTTTRKWRNQTKQLTNRYTEKKAPGNYEKTRRRRKHGEKRATELGGEKLRGPM